MTQETEEMKAFELRLHAQIELDLKPAVQQAKQDFLDKMRQPEVRDDKVKKQQVMQEYNDARRAIDKAGMEQFTNEVLREKMRRAEGEFHRGAYKLTT